MCSGINFLILETITELLSMNCTLSPIERYDSVGTHLRLKTFREYCHRVASIGNYEIKFAYDAELHCVVVSFVTMIRQRCNYDQHLDAAFHVFLYTTYPPFDGGITLLHGCLKLQKD